MQQRDSRINIEIAEETKRDSSAMKTLALITIVFLPTTAVAVSILTHWLLAMLKHLQTIFSMGTFFDTNTGDGGDQVKTSPQFWIFWCVAIPLTLGTLMIWILWINRKQVSQLWDKRRSMLQKRRFSTWKSSIKEDEEAQLQKESAEDDQEVVEPR